MQCNASGGAKKEGERWGFAVVGDDVHNSEQGAARDFRVRILGFRFMK